MQAAKQRAVVAPAPTLSPAEDFKEQKEEESHQRLTAISTLECTARECLGIQACSSDHDAPHLKGQPVNIIHFSRQYFKGISRAVVSVKGIEE